MTCVGWPAHPRWSRGDWGRSWLIRQRRSGPPGVAWASCSQRRRSRPWRCPETGPRRPCDPWARRPCHPRPTPLGSDAMAGKALPALDEPKLVLFPFWVERCNKLIGKGIRHPRCQGQFLVPHAVLYKRTQTRIIPIFGRDWMGTRPGHRGLRTSRESLNIKGAREHNLSGP